MAKVLAGFSSFLLRTQRLGLSASALHPGGNQQKQKTSLLLPQGSTETGSRRHLKRVSGSCQSWPEHRVEKRCPRTLATAIGWKEPPGGARSPPCTVSRSPRAAPRELGHAALPSLPTPRRRPNTRQLTHRVRLTSRGEQRAAPRI